MNNYFFVDGSSLLSDVRRARSELGIPPLSRLRLQGIVDFFCGSYFHQFHGGAYRRFVFYFVQDDERLRSLVEMPDHTTPGAISDLRFEYCGRRIRQFEQAKEWLDANQAPDSVRDCLYRSEKAVDTQICCDALQLAASGKLDRLFLYTNDFDFVPLCRAIRQLGANVNLMRLRASGVNSDLVKECDAFHAMDDGALRSCMVAAASPSTVSQPMTVGGSSQAGRADR